MKNIIFVLALFIGLAGTVTGQIDRSTPPPAGPAPTIQIGKYEAFTLDNGLRVIVVENDRSPSVSFQLTLDIHPPMEGDAAGYVSMAGSEMRSGTSTRDKATLDEEIDFIGATLSTSSRGMFASALSRHAEDLLELMSDVLLNPTFPQQELDRSITQMITGLSTTNTDAQAMVRNLSTAMLYGSDHPYGEVVTEETVKNITRDLLVEYYSTYFRPNVAYLVVVGDISTERAKELAERFFGNWEKGEVPRHEYATPQAPGERVVAFANRPGAVQSVFRIAYPVELTPGHPDQIKASVMNGVLGGGVFSGRLMQNLREDKGYTYGARSNLSADPIIGSFSAGAEVGNNVTDSAITEVLYEMERMVTERVDEETLELVKSFMNGSFARSLESPQTIARFALNIERYNLPEDYYATYLERLGAVTAADVQEMARKYIKPGRSYVLVAGNKDEVAERLEKFSHDGNVLFFDPFARPIEESKVELDESVTAKWVVSQYLDAIGGKERLSNIDDMTTVMEAEVMGNSMGITTKKMAPAKMLMEISMGGNVIQKEVFDGKTGYSMQMGQKIPFKEEDIEGKKIQAMIVKELTYLQEDADIELRGVERINGRDSYRIRVVSPDGTIVDEYYDIETHLKVRESVTVEQMGQSQTIINDFAEYQEFEGVMIPTRITLSGVMPIPLEMQATTVEINSDLSPEVFSVD